jgi:hypothetical protein
MAGVTDDEELVLGTLELVVGTVVFACARACGMKSSAADATINDPNRLVALL